MQLPNPFSQSDLVSQAHVVQTPCARNEIKLVAALALVVTSGTHTKAADQNACSTLTVQKIEHVSTTNAQIHALAFAEQTLNVKLLTIIPNAVVCSDTLEILMKTASTEKVNNHFT